MDEIVKTITIVLTVSGAAIMTIVPIIKWSMKEWVQKSKQLKEFEQQESNYKIDKIEKDINNCWKDVKELKNISHIFSEKDKTFEMSHLKLELKMQETIKNLSDLNLRLNSLDSTVDKKVTDVVQRELFKLGKVQMK